MTPSLIPSSTTGDRLALDHRLSAIAAGGIALGIYLLTLAPDLTWANGAYDGPELVTASATLGVAHPPGYPTYIVLGKLFSLLPLGTVAFRYNLFSAVAAAAAVGLCVLIIGTLFPRVRSSTALSAALLFGLAPLVWSQAVVAEIYSLNLLVIAGFLFIWSRRGASPLSGIFLGLAITTHLTSVFLLPGFIARSHRQFPHTLIGIAIGLTPLLLLPILAGGGSPVVWGRPTDLAGWWWLASGKLYNANYQLDLDSEHLRRLLQAIVFGPAALLWTRRLAEINPLPSVSYAHETRPTRVILGITAIIYLCFALFYKTPDAAILLLPPLLFTVIIAAPLMDRMGPAALILPLALALVTFQSRDISRTNVARPLADQILLTAPDRAILLTPGDRTIFTLLYFQYAEGRRPDLRLIDSNLFAFDWYRDRLALQYPDLLVPEGDDLNSFQRINKPNRPFCLTSLVAPFTGYPGELIAIPKITGSPPFFSCTED